MAKLIKTTCFSVSWCIHLSLPFTKPLIHSLPCKILCILWTCKCSLLPFRYPPINTQILSRHIRTRITRQEHTATSDVLGFCNPPVHNLILPAFQEIGELHSVYQPSKPNQIPTPPPQMANSKTRKGNQSYRRSHLRPHISRRNAINPNPILDQLLRDARHHGPDGALGAAVGTGALAADRHVACD